MNAKLKKAFAITLFCYLQCFGIDQRDVNMSSAPINKIGAFEYTQTNLPCGLSNSSLTLFQSPGLRAICCISQNVSDTSMLYITMILNSRFAPRFCNHHQGSLLLAPTYAAILDMTSSWVTGPLSSLITPIPNGLSRNIALSHTTSGISITLSGPSNLASNFFLMLNTMLNNIYGYTLSDSQCDTYFTNLSTSLSNSVTVAKNSSGNNLTNQDILFSTQIQPKWDCIHQNGTYQIGFQFSLPVGSYESFAQSTLSTSIGSTLARKNTQLALSLLKLEKDISLYIVSSDSSVLSTIPTGLQAMSQAFSFTQCPAFKQPTYGYIVPKGNSIPIVRSSGTNSANGCTIFLGPCTADSLIAAELIVMLVNNNITTLIQNAYGSGSMSATILPAGGQITVRIYSNNPLNGTNSWITFLNNLKTRYSSSTNISTDSADTNYQNSITSVYNKLIPSSTHSANDSGLYDQVLSANCKGYTNWLMLFHGGYNAFVDLQSLASTTSTNKQQALTRACNLIAQQADPTIASGVHYSIS